jgi:hypothetical protein
MLGRIYFICLFYKVPIVHTQRRRPEVLRTSNLIGG